MRSYDEAYAAARDEPAFSNGTEGEAWTENWCERCVHDSPELVDRGEGCPLIMVALMGRTPGEWLRQEGFRLGDQYRCVEFRDQDDPGPGYEAPPDPPLPGQEVLFAVEPHARIYADVAAEARREAVGADVG
jgi:hypothetical protein